MSYRWLLAGWLTILQVASQAAYGQGREICLERFPSTPLGNEVKPVVEQMIGFTNLQLISEPCPLSAYRLQNIIVREAFSEIAIEACFLPPSVQKHESCTTLGAAPVPADATKRRAAIEEAVAALFHNSLFAVPDTPLGYYSVLSCSESLQFKLQLAQGAAKPPTFAPCFYRLAFRKVSLDASWLDAKKHYVRSHTREAIPASGQFAVSLAHWAYAPRDDRADLESSCRTGSYRGALLIPYLRPGKAIGEEIPWRGFRAGPAADTGSNPSGKSK